MVIVKAMSRERSSVELEVEMWIEMDGCSDPAVVDVDMVSGVQV